MVHLPGREGEERGKDEERDRREGRRKGERERRGGGEVERARERDRERERERERVQETGKEEGGRGENTSFLRHNAPPPPSNQKEREQEFLTSSDGDEVALADLNDVVTGHRLCVCLVGVKHQRTYSTPCSQHISPAHCGGVYMYTSDKATTYVRLKNSFFLHAGKSLSMASMDMHTQCVLNSIFTYNTFFTYCTCKYMYIHVHITVLYVHCTPVIRGETSFALYKL